MNDNSGFIDFHAIANEARQQALDKRNTHVLILDQVETPIREFISAYEERQADSHLALLPHKRALEEIEFLRANGITEVSVIVEQSDALGDELAWKVLDIAEDLRAQEKGKSAVPEPPQHLRSADEDRARSISGRER